MLLSLSPLKLTTTHHSRCTTWKRVTTMHDETVETTAEDAFRIYASLGGNHTQFKPRGVLEGGVPIRTLAIWAKEHD